jgi:predicted  nucleic acid-binding Zn-ribbon protein
MPHQCTNCGRTFADGSKQMLSGCPDCDGNKFQFKPAGAADGNAGSGGAGAASPATEPKKTPESARGGTDDAQRAQQDGRSDDDDRSGAVNRAAATVRDWVGTRGDSEESAEPGQSDSTRNEPPDGVKSSTARTDSAASTDSPTKPNAAPSTEDSAQASARTDVVSQSELPDDPPEGTTQEGPVQAEADDPNVVDAPDDDNPGLKELREELNSQFESIRIVNPGQYELNLMELYEREEYIISLQEDGKYVIEVPDAWDAVER